MKFKKIEKNILICSLSVVGLGAVVGTSLAVANSLHSKEATLENDNIQGENNKVFLGTTLTNEDVKLLGWDRKTSISLSDWAKQAPKVTQIGNGDSLSAPFYANNRLESIEIPAQITNINKAAFYSTSSLRNITFEDNSSIDSIGELAFNNSAIEGITIPESVKTIGASAFANTPNLKPEKIVISSELMQNSDQPLYGFSEDQWSSAGPSLRVWYNPTLTPQAVQEIGWNRKENITLADWRAQAPNVTQIGLFSNTSNKGAPFLENTILKRIEIPAKITGINHSAFDGARNLTGLVFEQNSQLREIGLFAFQRTGLTEFRIPDNVITLRDTIFGSETPITRLVVNSSLVNVSTPFHAMIHLKSVSMPKKYSGSNAPGPDYWGFTQQQWNTIVTFRPDVFRGDILTKQDVRNLGWDRQTRITRQDWADFAPNVTQLSRPNVSSGPGTDSAFSGLTSLQYIELPDTIRKINYATFFQARNLRTVDLTANSQLNTIAGFSFRQSGVTSIYIPRDVLQIGEYAFDVVTSLNRVNFHPNSKLNEIKEGAFTRTNIQSMVVPDSVRTIAFAFEGSTSSGSGISMPAHLKQNSTTPKYGFTQAQWNNITFRPELYIGEILTKTAAISLGWDRKTRITLDDWKLAPYVKHLGDPNVNTGDGGAAPFQNNRNLQSIAIPDSVIGINFGAFSGASNLTSITFSNSSNLAKIGRYAFNNANIRNISIPDKVTEIDRYAFLRNRSLGRVGFTANSRLTSIRHGAFEESGITHIDVPNSVTLIEDYAFFKTNSLLGSNVSMSRELQKGSTRPLYQFTQAQWNAIVWKRSVFRGTTLTKQDVINLGWDRQTTITLNDWRTWAPNVTQIGDPNLNSGDGRPAPFSFNSALQTIAIPNKVTHINFAAFHQTTALQTVTFEGGSRLTNVNGYSFRQSSIRNITLPGTVSVIGDHAFDETKITSINIPRSVRTLSTRAFNLTRQLQRVTFESGSTLNQISNYVFADSGITSMMIPKSVTSIGTYAFLRTKQLKTFSFEEQSRITTLGKGVWQESGFTNLFLPDSLTNVQSNSFEFSGSIVTISMSSKLRKGSLNALYGFNQTQWNRISWRVETFTGTTLKKYDVINLDWWGKTQITSADWNKAPSVTHLGSANVSEAPFASNTTLTSIVLPAKISHINASAFARTSALTTLTFQSGSVLQSIGNNAFDSSGIRAISLADSVTEIATNAFLNTTALAGAQVSMSSRMRKGSLTALYGFTTPQWNSINWRISQFTGVTLLKADVINLNWHTKTSITLNDWTRWAPNVTKISTTATTGAGDTAAFGNNAVLRSIDIPAKITEINFGSFYNTTALQTVTIAASSQLNKIENAAFNQSALRAINIPNKVRTIGNAAFQTNANLANVTFEAGSQLTSIGNFAFYQSYVLRSMIIPSGVTTIGTNAFQSSGLRSITLPNSVTSIGTDAFKSTTELQGNRVSALITLRNASDSPLYGFTEQQWSQIGWRTIPFNGTTLHKVDVEKLGWNLKTSITLADWEQDAPKVTEISSHATMGEAPTAAFSANTRLRSIVIPSRITKINFGSFFNTTALQSVTFEPNSKLQLIGGAAFRLSTLNAIEIPASVTEVSNHAFQSAGQLRTISFAPGSKLAKIGNGTFDSVPISSIVIPDSVNSIGTQAFLNTNSLLGQNVSMDIKLKQNSTQPLYGFTQTQWNAIRWRGNVNLTDTINRSFLIDFKEGSNIVNLPALNSRASSQMSGEARDAGLALQFAIGTSESNLIAQWGTAEQVKAAITAYAATKDILKTELNIFARMYLPTGTGQDNDMIGEVKYIWNKSVVKIYDNNSGTIANLFVAPSSSGPTLAAGKFIRAYAHIENTWASSLIAGGNKASAVKISSGDNLFDISKYTAKGVKLEVSPNAGGTWTTITAFGAQSFDASATNKMQFRLSVLNPQFYEMVGTTVAVTNPTGTMTTVVEKDVVAKIELKGISASELATSKIAVSGSTQNLSIQENPSLYTVSGLTEAVAKTIFQIKYSYDGTNYLIASAFGAKLRAMRGSELNALNLANFKVKYEFTTSGLEKYYSPEVSNDPEAIPANTIKTLLTTNVKKTIDLTQEILDVSKIIIAGSTERFTWTNNNSILALTPLVKVEYGTYTRADNGTLTYGWSTTMPTSIYANTIPAGQTNYPLAIRFVSKVEGAKEEIGSISTSSVFTPSNTTMGYAVDVSKLVSVINVDTTELINKLILTGYANNLNNGQTVEQIEAEALNLVDLTFRSQVKLEYQISNLPNEWLSLVDLKTHMASYMNDYSNSTSGIMIFNNATISGVTIQAKFVAKDPEKFVVQSTPQDVVTLNTSGIKTNVDLREYVKVLQSQKVIPSGTSADNLGTLTLPNMIGGNVPFSQKTFDQISAILSSSIDIQFKAPGFNNNNWVALNEITAVNVNNELFIRFVVKQGAKTNIDLSLINANDWEQHQNNGFKLTLNLPIEIQVNSADLTRLISLTGSTKNLVINDDQVYVELDKNQLYVGKVKILYTIGKSPIALDPALPEKTEFTKIELTNLLRNYTTDITLEEKEITAKYALADGVTTDDYIIKDPNPAVLNIADVLLFINKSDYYAIAERLKVSGTSSELIWGPEITELANKLSKGLTLQYTTDPSATANDAPNDAKWSTNRPMTIDPNVKFLAVRMVTVTGYIFEEQPKLFKVNTDNVLLVIQLKANDLQSIGLTGNTKDITLDLTAFNNALTTAGIPGQQFIVVQYYFGASAPAGLNLPTGEWFNEAQIKQILQTLKGAKNTQELILLRDSLKVRYSLSDEGYKTYRMNIDGTFINEQFTEQPALWKPLVTDTINAEFKGYINLDLVNTFTPDNFQVFGSDKKPRLKPSEAISKMLDFYKDPTITPFDIFYSKSRTDFSNVNHKLFGATGFIDNFAQDFIIDLDSAGQAVPIYFKIVARPGYQIWENNVEQANGKVIEITNFDIQPQIANPLLAAPDIKFVTSAGERFYQGEGSFTVYASGTGTLVDQTFLNKEYPTVTPPVLKLEYNVSDVLYSNEELEEIKIDPTKWTDAVPTDLRVGQYVMTRVAVNNPIFTMTGGDAMTSQVRVHGLKVRVSDLALSPDVTLTNTEIYGYAPLDGQAKIETATIVADSLGNYLGADLEMSVNSQFYTDASGRIIVDANNIPIIKRNPEGAKQEGTYKDANGKEILDGSGQAIPIWTVERNGSVIPAPPLATGTYRAPQKMIDWSVPGSFSQDDTGILDWRLFEGQTVRFSFVPRIGQGTAANPDFVFDTPASRVAQPEITLSTIKYIIPTQGITYRFDQAQLKDITYASDDAGDIAYTGASHISSPLSIIKVSANYDEEVITGKAIEEQVALDYGNRVQIKMQLNKKNGTTQTAFGSDVSQFTGLQNGDVLTISFESKDNNYALPRPIAPLTIMVKNLFIKPLDVDLFKFLRPDFTGSLNGSGAFSIKVTNPNIPTETNETVLGIDQWYEYQVWNPDKSLKTAWTRDETKINNLVNGDKVEWKLVNKDGIFQNDYYNTLLAETSTPQDIKFRVVNVVDRIEETVQEGIGSSQEINPDNIDGSSNYPETSGWVVSGLKIEISLDSIQQEKFEQALAQFQPTFSGVDKFGQMSSNISNDSSISKDVVIVWYTSSEDGMPRRITDFKEAGLSNGDKVWATIAPSQEAMENNLIIDESISQMSSKVFVVEGLTTIVNSSTQTLMVSLITASSVILVGTIAAIVFMRKNGKLGGNKKFKL